MLLLFDDTCPYFTITSAFEGLTEHRRQQIVRVRATNKWWLIAVSIYPYIYDILHLYIERVVYWHTHTQEKLLVTVYPIMRRIYELFEHDTKLLHSTILWSLVIKQRIWCPSHIEKHCSCHCLSQLNKLTIHFHHLFLIRFAGISKFSYISCRL